VKVVDPVLAPIAEHVAVSSSKAHPLDWQPHILAGRTEPHQEGVSIVKNDYMEVELAIVRRVTIMRSFILI
jgi:hypothetical protein